ncbi:MAG: hypothetical protein RLY31_2943, partial [Bacteroidota bacterium]
MKHVYATKMLFALQLLALWLMPVLGGSQTADPIGPVTGILDQTLASGNLPAIIDNAGNNRGAGFNGTHVYVASRQNGNHVYYWDVTDPGNVGELDLTGVSGGTFVLSDLTVSGNHVLVSNMVFVGGTFRVYHWSDASAAPTVLLEYANAPARLGDAISVIGDPDTSAKLVVSGHGSKNFYIWDIIGGNIPNTDPTVVTFDNVDNVNFARITAAPGNDNLYIASGPVFRMLLLDASFDVLDQVDGTFFQAWPMYLQAFELEGKRYLAYVHVSITPAENALHILDISAGGGLQEAIQEMKNASVSALLARNIPLGNVANGNASASLDLVTDASGEVWAMAYAAGNGLLVEKYGGTPPPQPVDPLSPVDTVLEASAAAGTLPAIIDNAGNNRGAGFNGTHVYVASRQNGNHVYYWDVNDAAAGPSELDLTGVTGGTFT